MLWLRAWRVKARNGVLQRARPCMHTTSSTSWLLLLLLLLLEVAPSNVR